VTRFSLFVEKGRLGSEQFELTNESTTLGSAALNDIALPDDPSIARVHAEIRRSANGLITIAPVGKEITTVNGKAITVVTPLKVNDRIAIGRHYQFRITDGDLTAPPPDAASTGVAGTLTPAPAGGMKVPIWVLAYLIGMVVAAAYLGFSRGSGVESLATVTAREVQFAGERQLPQEETDRVLRLLTVGQIYEQQGKPQTAYEVYRDLLGARKPAQPESPAYRFATTRMVAVGGQ